MKMPVSEYNNRSVYKDGVGCRSVPLLVIYQRYLDVITLLLPFLIETARGCREPTSQMNS
jgi:hypothetical protein